MFNKIIELLKVVFKFPSYSTIHDLFDALSKVSLKIFYTSVSAITFYIFVSSLLTSQFTMKPFSIPANFSSDGYSGEILSREVMDRFNQITRETLEMKEEDDEDEGDLDKKGQKPAKKDTLAAKNKFISDIRAINFSNGIENLDVEVLGLGLSVGKLSEYIRILLGVEVKKITGELIKKDDTFVLNMRLTGHPPLNFVADVEGTDYEKIKYLEEKAALALKKYFSPLELAFYLYKKENYDEAIEAADYAIENENVNNKHWAHYIKAQAEIEGYEHYEHSYESFESATNEFEGFVEAWYNWGYYLYKQGQFREAIKKLEKVVEFDNSHSQAQLYLGQSFIALFDYEKGVKKYKEALKNNPDDYYINYSVAFDLGTIGRYKESIKYYKKALESEPSETSYYMNLAESYFYSGDTAAALDIYVDAKNNVKYFDDQQELYVEWAKTLLVTGRRQEAIATYSQHLLWTDKLEQYSHDDIVYEIYDELLTSEFHKQKVNFLRAIINTKDYYSYSLTDLGNTYWKIGEYDSAIFYYHMFMDTYVTEESYYIDIAEAYAAKSDFKKAMDYYKLERETEGNSRNLYALWGMALYRNNELLQAKNMLEKGRAIGVWTTKEIYHGLALVGEKLEDDQISLTYYYQALDKDKANDNQDPLLRMDYAGLLLKVGKKEKADSIIRHIFTLDDFDDRFMAKSIYEMRGLEVCENYYNTLIQYSPKKGKLYTLLAYAYALDRNDEAYFANMKKAKDEGFPIKGLVRYFPYNKVEYTDKMNAMTNQ